MNKGRSIILLLTVLILSILIVGAAELSQSPNLALAITGQSTGYVQYKITISSPKTVAPRTIMVNESAQPTSQTGFTDIAIFLASPTANFTYSKVVNASSLPEIFPYLPGLTNESLAYEFNGISIKANLANIGSVSVTFSGTSYQATKYLFSLSATNTSNLKSISTNGTLISMPSGLIDTIQFTLNQTSVNIALASTNLALNDSTSVNPIGVSLLGVGGVLAVAIAIPTLFKIRRNKPTDNIKTNKMKTDQQDNAKQESENEEKPSYWVD